MTKADESGERKSIGEKTHISLRSACAIVVLAVMPLTWFVASLKYGQEATNSKIDALNETMNIRRQQRDKEYSDMNHRVDDHEVRIRTLEAKH